MENDTHVNDIFRKVIADLVAKKKKERDENGKKMTQKKMAEAMDMDPNHFSGWLNGHRDYSETKLKTVANYFGKNYSQILSMENNNGSATLPGNIHRINDTREDVIRQFQNQSLALEINQMLVEIERDDPAKLEHIKGIVATFISKKQATKKRAAANDNQ